MAEISPLETKGGFELVVRIAAAAAILAHAVLAIQTIQVISVFSSELTPSLFSASIFQISQSFVSIVLGALVVFRVYWSLWAWALAVFSIGGVGLLLGLDTRILNWDQLVPVALLVTSLFWARSFATPWKNGNRRYRVLLLCLGSIVISAALGVASVSLAEAEFRRDRELRTDQPVPNALLERYANILNRDLPRMVDDQTRLERISVDGDWLVSEIGLVAQTANSLPALEVEQSIREQMMPSVCSIPALPDGQSSIMQIRYQVRYTNGDLAAIVEISTEDCP
jgi:hypothetical protein